MGIILTDFQGELPGVSNYDLPPNAASEAINCEFGGTVRPARFSSTTPDTSTTGWPIKVYNQWFVSETPNGILPSPMADDSIDRMYKLSNGRLQRALLSSPSSWVDVGIESPSVPMTVEVIQPTVVRPSEGIEAPPQGEQATFVFALMYFGRGDDGKQYYSDRLEGSFAGYSNSQLVITLSDNWLQDLNNVRTRVRTENPRNGYTPFRNSYNGIHLGVFKSLNGTWVLVADINSGIDSSGHCVVPFNASGNPDWTYNSNNKLNYIVDHGYNSDGFSLFDTVYPKPAAPKNVEIVQSSNTTSGTTLLEDTPNGEVGISRAYIYTVCRIVADDSGNTVVEEGQPSIPVIVDNVYSNSQVKIAFSSAVPAGYRFSIYRAHAGMYLYVGDCTAGASQFEDNVPDAALGEECPSFDWLPPPLLDGVISTGYGFFVGWKGNRVYCSEVYLPHAWPAAYNYTTKYNIRRMLAIHNGILVITDNGNYFISGSTPRGLSLVEMPTFHPCIAADTAVDMGSGVMYVAPTGLALVNASGAQLVTEGLIDPTWWADQDFSNAYAYRAGDLYVLTIEDTRYAFNLAKRTISKATGLPARATFDQATGVLRTVSGAISPASLADSYKWVSKIFEFNNGQSYKWTQCIATDYPVTATWRLWQSDDSYTEYDITYRDHHPVRFIPNRWHRVQVALETDKPVSRISVVNKKEELEYVG